MALAVGASSFAAHAADDAAVPLAESEIELADLAHPLHVETGLLEVSAGDGTVAATAGYFSYTARTGGGSGPRPVLFAFNGGPGASSSFLHMGTLGPVLAHVPQDPAAVAPESVSFIAGSSALYRLADVVLIDPPGTGFSSRPSGEAEAPYRTAAGDGAASAALVAAWLERNGRSDAPIYILGESYGTIRAVAMLDTLEQKGLADNVHGIVLLGQALNMIETSQRPDNVVTYPVSLPSLAAIACYHGLLSADCTPEAAAAEASRFGREEYLPALYLGRDLPNVEQQRIADRLEELSGIPASFYLANDLRISKERFRVELLRSRGQVIGRYDARYLAPRPKNVTTMMGPDPASVISDIYADAVKQYLDERLGVEDTESYQVISRIEAPWLYGSGDSPFSDWPFMEVVERHAARNACLRLFVGTGIYDLTTTIGAADYLFAQSSLPESRWRNERYGGGHVFYSDDRSRADFLSDLAGFVASDKCR